MRPLAVRLRRCLIAVLAVGTFVAVGYWLENWRGEREWTKTKILLAGFDLSWRSYVPPTVPETENGALHPFFKPLLLYDQKRVKNPQGGFDVVNTWADSNGLARLRVVRLPLGWRANGEFHATATNSSGTLTDLAAWQSCLRQDTNFPSRSTVGSPASDVLFALGRFDAELREVHEALSQNHFRFPVHYQERPMDMLLSHAVALKSIAEVLRLRAAARLALDETDSAFQDVRDLIRLAATLRGEPMRISLLIRLSLHQTACEAIRAGLARSSWSDQHLADFARLLAAENFLAEWSFAKKAEAAGAVQTLDDVYAEGGTVMFVHPPPEGEGCREFLPLWWMPRGWFRQNQVRLARHVAHFALPAVDVDTRRVFRSKVRQDEELRSVVSPYSMFAVLMFPPVEDILRAAAAQTRNDLAVVASAVARYRIRNRSLPETLAALPADLLASVPRDVISGAPVKYRKTSNDDFVLWSVGWNEQDEGGKTAHSANGDVRYGKEGDWVWVGHN